MNTSNCKKEGASKAQKLEYNPDKYWIGFQYCKKTAFEECWWVSILPPERRDGWKRSRGPQRLPHKGSNNFPILYTGNMTSRP